MHPLYSRNKSILEGVSDISKVKLQLELGVSHLGSYKTKRSNKRTRNQTVHLTARGSGTPQATHALFLDFEPDCF